MKHVVGIIGEAGCGKTTFANRLCDQHGFVQYSFSRPLKELCCELYGWNLTALEHDGPAQEFGFPTALAYKESPSGHEPFVVDVSFGQAIANTQGVREIPRAVDHLIRIFSGITPEWTRRKILQHVGTEGFRALDSEHWVKKGKTAMLELMTYDGVAGIAIPDMRFLNESAAVVREMGGKIIRLIRAGDFEGTSETGHSSEQERRKIAPDLVITSPNGVEHVQRRADHMMGSFSWLT